MGERMEIEALKRGNLCLKSFIKAQNCIQVSDQQPCALSSRDQSSEVGLVSCQASSTRGIAKCPARFSLKCQQKEQNHDKLENFSLPLTGHQGRI